MRHKHVDLIHAWAEGAEIQIKCSKEWVNCNPTWHPNEEYRIKPKIIKKEGWVNIYRSYNPMMPRICSNVFESKADSVLCADDALATLKIEWEEEVE